LNDMRKKPPAGTSRNETVVCQPKMATRFPSWATSVLREYMLRGFALVKTARSPDIVLNALPG